MEADRPLGGVTYWLRPAAAARPAAVFRFISHFRRRTTAATSSSTNPTAPRTMPAILFELRPKELPPMGNGGAVAVVVGVTVVGGPAVVVVCWLAVVEEDKKEVEDIDKDGDVGLVLVVVEVGNVDAAVVLNTVGGLDVITVGSVVADVVSGGGMVLLNMLASPLDVENVENGGEKGGVVWAVVPGGRDAITEVDSKGEDSMEDAKVGVAVGGALAVGGVVNMVVVVKTVVVALGAMVIVIKVVSVMVLKIVVVDKGGAVTVTSTVVVCVVKTVDVVVNTGAEAGAVCPSTCRRRFGPPTNDVTVTVFVCVSCPGSTTVIVLVTVVTMTDVNVAIGGALDWMGAAVIVSVAVAVLVAVVVVAPPPSIGQHVPLPPSAAKQHRKPGAQQLKPPAVSGQHVEQPGQTGLWPLLLDAAQTTCIVVEHWALSSRPCNSGGYRCRRCVVV